IHPLPEIPEKQPDLRQGLWRRVVEQAGTFEQAEFVTLQFEIQRSRTRATFEGHGALLGSFLHLRRQDFHHRLHLVFRPADQGLEFHAWTVNARSRTFASPTIDMKTGAGPVNSPAPAWNFQRRQTSRLPHGGSITRPSRSA